MAKRKASKRVGMILKFSDKSKKLICSNVEKREGYSKKFDKLRKSIMSKKIKLREIRKIRKNKKSRRFRKKSRKLWRKKNKII